MLQMLVKNYGLYSQTQQEVAHRVYDSVLRVFRLRKNGVKCGFPRFKSFERMKSLYYPQFGFSLKDKLDVTPFGKIAVRKHREIKGRVKTLVLKREPTGKWFAIFTAEEERVESKKNHGEIVGVDLGLKMFAVLSNGMAFSNPRHLSKYEQRLALVQHKLSKKNKRGRNKLKARLSVARVHEKVKNSRLDFLHKLSTHLVSTYSIISLEKLPVKEMAEQAFGKQIHDASWGKFADMICYKAEEAGSKVVFVNPKNTSKTCSNCGSLQDLLLQARTFECHSCGMIKDRDLNAAQNILNRATVGTTGRNASEDETAVSSMKEETHAFKRE